MQYHFKSSTTLRTAQGHKKDGEEVLKYADQSCSMIQSRCLTFGAHTGRQGGAVAVDDAGGTIYLSSKHALDDQLPNLCSQTWPQDNKEEQEELSTLAVQLASIVDTLDKIAADNEAMEDAAVQFDSLLQARGLVWFIDRADRAAAHRRQARQPPASACVCQPPHLLKSSFPHLLQHSQLGKCDTFQL